MDFGLSYADVKDLKHVEVQYHDAQMPAVLLWQADVLEADDTTQTLKVHITNTGKTARVSARQVRKRQRGSAAV